MIFYRFKGNDDLWLGKYGKNQNTLIPNELKTEKEIENIKATSPRLSIDKAFERIDIPKSDIYTSFGVRFQNGYDHNGKTESIKRCATKVKINEAESYGWVVEDWQASEAYELACDYFGEDDINRQIVDCMSNEELAACLAFIFRMNNFEEWDEYLARENVDESVNNSNRKKFMKEYVDEVYGVIRCVETGEEQGYSSLVDREWIIADLVDKGYTYVDRPVRVETGYREYDNYLN